MSVNKIKSLRLQRSQRLDATNKIEDISMILAEETKTHVERIELSTRVSDGQAPLHSTPKRSSLKPEESLQEESRLDYRVSPILLPCTQEGGNGVAWDWQSPQTRSKINERKSGTVEQSGTPKRTCLLQKKRNSNSPLLYKPIKRKLMRNEHHQEIAEFTAEMKALTEQIKTVPKDEAASDERKTNLSEDELLLEIDIADFADSEPRLEAKSSENSRRKNGEEKTSMDDLFDESIEDSMVKCSQEVEEKLRLESCRESSSKLNSGLSTSGKESSSSSSWHQNSSFSRFHTAKEQTNVEAPRNSPKLLGDSSKATCKSAEESRRNVAAEKIVEKVSSTAKTKEIDELFDIPDDSFDDFLAVCVDDIENVAGKTKQQQEKLTNQSSSRYGKFYASPHATCSNENSRKCENSAARKNLLLPPPSQTSCGLLGTSSTLEKGGKGFFPRSASNDCLKPQQQTTTTMTMNNNQERKFFKTKSLSTSSFEDSGKNGNASSSSGLISRGWKSNIFKNGSVTSSVSSNQPANGDLNGEARSSCAWSKAKAEKDVGNRGIICNVNRSGPREGASFRLKSGAGSLEAKTTIQPTPNGTSHQTTSICTPEEIERKRMEAKMKLEAKRKLMARSNSTSALNAGNQIRRPPVKR